MKVVVIGGGVIGVTTAWFLMREGHEVIVVDRQSGVGLETSYANAGEISPGYATPWASPGLAIKALKWMFMRHAPLVLHPSMDPGQYRWMAEVLKNCSLPKYRLNKERMMRIAQYSQEILRDLRLSLGLEYDARSLGLLQLFRTESQMQRVAEDTAVLEQFGVPYEILDRSGCIAAESGLRYASAPFVGGLRLAGDETGDCYKFTSALADLAAAHGVGFCNDARVEKLHVWKDAVVAVETSRGDIVGDVYVAAAGSYTPQLLKGTGVSVPVAPIKGYSLTFPVADVSRAPVSTLMDETHKVAITRLGHNVRVAGMAELAGYDLRLNVRRRATLEKVVEDLFPGAGRSSDGAFWSGLRSMTPDSVPVLGPTAIRNLYLNTGHGTLGWTMACGSARIVSDLVSGRRPDINVEGLTVDRFQPKPPGKRPKRRSPGWVASWPGW